MPVRAVITGGAGFVGSHLAERLLAEGIDVVCLDNFSTGSPDNVAHLLDHPGFELVVADVTEELDLVGPVDYVLHLASPASPVDYAERPVETLKAGSLGTLNTLDLARRTGARYLVASTSETYGDPLVHPQPETYWGNVNPVGPRACYDEAKRFAEAATTTYRTHHGVDTTVLRIFNTYGPRMRRSDGRAVPTFVRQALAGEPLTVAGDGQQTRSLCYVDDLVDGIWRLLRSTLPGPVNIGNPHELSVLEIAELVRDVTGSSSEIEFVERPVDDPSRRRPDITLARTELDWAPRVGPAEGLGRTVEWFRTVGAEPLDRTVERPTAGPESHGAMRIAVVGTGYVGAVTAACLAWLGHRVCGLDADAVLAGQLNQGQVPFFEARLPEVLTEALHLGNLEFVSDPEKAFAGADCVFLCVGTPATATGTPDLTQMENAVDALAPHLGDGTIIINKSTVPVGSGNWVRSQLEERLPRTAQSSFHVVSNPEFLREGTAVDDFLRPDRIVLGGDPAAVAVVADVYRPILSQRFRGGRPGSRPQLITTTLASAEMIKYAANAFLATKISFANEVAGICELVGAGARQVLPAIGADQRIGGRFLEPGLGWGGSCFGKDIAALVATGQEYGYPSELLRATIDVNQMQRAGIVRKLQRDLHVLKGRRVAVLGLAFKPGTDDLRDAPALDVIRRLLAAGVIVTAYDPVVKALPDGFGAVRVAADAYDAAYRADAVVVATEWPEFDGLDGALLREVMRGDLVLDGRNTLRESAFAGTGTRLEGVGW